MALVTLHREDFSGLNGERFRARLRELQEKYPAPATVTYRRWPRYGNGYTFYVKGEGKPTRTQTRAHCQFCGNDQVVKDDVLVLHGYERPGHGWIYGRCPGVGKAPLQKAEDLTREWLSASETALAKAELEQPKLDRAAMAARRAYDRSSTGGAYMYPDRPYKPTPEKETAWREKVKEWAKKYPLAARLREKEAAARDGQTRIRQYTSQIDHFKTLLGWKLLGTEYLVKEW